MSTHTERPIICGLGSHTGAAFVAGYEASRKSTSPAYYCWFQGFLSSVNLGRTADGRMPVACEPTDDQVMEDRAFLQHFCERFPDRQFVHAALALISQREKEMAEEVAHASAGNAA